MRICTKMTKKGTNWCRGIKRYINRVNDKRKKRKKKRDQTRKSYLSCSELLRSVSGSSRWENLDPVVWSRHEANI